jgi:hypothetical protein
MLMFEVSLYVLRETICQVTPIAMMSKTKITQVFISVNTIEATIPNHRKEIVVILTLTGVPRFSR